MNYVPTTYTGNKRQLAQDNISKDVQYALAEVNKLLSTLSLYGLNVDLRLRKLDFLTTDVLTTYMTGTTNTVNSASGKITFQTWLLQTAAFTTYSYDFALLLTGANLYGTGGSTESSNTNIGSVCNGVSAVSIAEFQGTYRDVVSLAHAIGFMLGANNDDATSTYIMSPYNYATQPNRWSYSSITAAYMKLFFSQLSPNCLLTTNSQSTRLTVSYGTYTGDELNPDIVCQRALGTKQTSFCRTLSPLNGDAVCSQIYCRVPGTQTCTAIFPSDGTPCNRQKRCNSGTCQPDSTAATQNLDPNCVWGDQTTLELPSVPYVGSCPGFVALYKPINCYVTSLQQQCCGTCKQYYTGRVGCEYGDKSLSCTKYTKASVCPTYGNTLCCGYCYGYMGKRSILDGIGQPPINITLTPPVNPRGIIGQEHKDRISGPH
ncbi:metalloprotease mig-17-like [Physella acuta]|uniref:metalloprotease mig-17-like n=1 Tax=Physella acuta TaxID=109671 RepID=UPI0027DCD36F|nr:metalloprotease mig-17-like [Physella acuta]